MCPVSQSNTANWGGLPQKVLQPINSPVTTHLTSHLAEQLAWCGVALKCGCWEWWWRAGQWCQAAVLAAEESASAGRTSGRQAMPCLQNKCNSEVMKWLQTMPFIQSELKWTWCNFISQVSVVNRIEKLSFWFSTLISGQKDTARHDSLTPNTSKQAITYIREDPHIHTNPNQYASSGTGNGWNVPSHPLTLIQKKKGERLGNGKRERDTWHKKSRMKTPGLLLMSSCCRCRVQWGNLRPDSPVSEGLWPLRVGGRGGNPVLDGEGLFSRFSFASTPES